MVKKARSIRKEHGILPDELSTKKGSRELPQATVEQVIAFFQSDDEEARMITEHFHKILFFMVLLCSMHDDLTCKLII